MRQNSKTVMTAVLAIAMTVAAAIVPGNSFAGKKRFVPQHPGEVIFLRGLANIFSLGLDSLSEELKKYGVYSVVHNHKAWKDLGNQLIARNRTGQLSYPVVIIGHSLGAGAAPRLATMLGRQNIPVEYMVMLDAVEPLPVTNFVEEAINYYLPKKRGQNLVTASKDFTGVYENINVKENLAGIDHFNIDENEKLRGQMTNRIFELIRKREEEQPNK